MMPSGRIAYMKKLVDEGNADTLVPPSKEEISEWKGVYLSYFNSDISSSKGRVMPLKYCVKNPRPEEIVKALSELKIRNIFESNKRRPTDNDVLRGCGRIKFRLFDNLGNLSDDKYTSKKQVMRLIGESIVKQRADMTDEQRTAKEKEGIFNMEEAQA